MFQNNKINYWCALRRSIWEEHLKRGKSIKYVYATYDMFTEDFPQQSGHQVDKNILLMDTSLPSSFPRPH